MIFKPLFRKFFMMTVLVFAGMTALSYFLSGLWEKYERERFFKSQAAEIWNQIENHDGDKMAFVKDLNALNEKMRSPVRIELKPFSEIPVTENNPEPSSIQTIEIEHTLYNLVVSLRRPHFGGMRGPGGPPPFGPPPGDPGHPPRPWAMGPRLVTFLAMIIAILFASALSMVLIFRSIRSRADLAKDVLGRMQKGDLKARFPISEWDEASRFFQLYNQMADEIERLVDTLRENEKTRVGLLQELAHDLRTPVSSLKNVIETIRFDEEKLDSKTKEELKDVAFHETEYLSQLVEDLLFLALVLEPKYKVESKDIFVNELVGQQVHAMSGLHPKIRCDIQRASQNLSVTGSPHLLRRLLRNGLSNACSFAKSRVDVSYAEKNEFLKIVIRDDGPGLSPNALESFGKKKSGTRYDIGDRGRLSIGLGSVIMQTIAHAHGGSVEIRNVLGSDGSIHGAELTIRIRCALQVAKIA